MISISGKVIKGRQFGRVLGFPTANLDRRQYVKEKINVKLGVWAGSAIIEPADVVQARGLPKLAGRRGLTLLAAIIIGPIDKTGRPKIEAHLINFNGNLYGKKITIILKKYIRPFKKYKNIDDLKKQIWKDVKKVRSLNF